LQPVQQLALLLAFRSPELVRFQALLPGLALRH
jgi:hypothetical protein